MKTIQKFYEIFIAEDGKEFDDGTVCWNYDINLITYFFRVTKPDYCTDLYKIVGQEKFVNHQISSFLRSRYGAMFGAKDGIIHQNYSIDMLHKLIFDELLNNGEYVDFYTLRVTDLGGGFELNPTCENFSKAVQNLDTI